MTDASTNPYAFTDTGHAPEATPTSVRPKWTTFIGVVALVLGIIGLLVAFGGLAGQVFGRRIQQQIIGAAEENPENAQLQMQADIQSATMGVVDKYFVPSMIVKTASLFSCIGLVVGAILLLKRSPLACKLMLIACVVTIVVDLGKAVVDGMMQRENMQLMGDVVPGAIAVDPNIPEETSKQVQKLTRSAMTVMGIVMLVMSALWFLLKAAFYLFSITYLSKPHVRGYFQVATAVENP